MATRLNAARLLVGLAAILVLVGCGPPAGTVFRASLSTPEGDYALPVTLGDQTGLVVSMEPAALEESRGDELRVVADGDDPNVLILSWMGGACEDETVVGFWPNEERYGMYVAHRGGPGLGGGCPAIAIPRVLRITLSEPIDPGLIDFTS